MKKIKDLFNKFSAVDRAELEIFISEIIGKEKTFVIAHPEYPISIIQYLRLRYFIFLYKKGYSVAAIIGHKEFYGLDFLVNKKVLIPRPDTELMVEEAIGIINNELRIRNTNIAYVDVGTGSGCIPISILKNIEGSIETYATDISKQALRVANKNAKKYMVNIKFIHGNLLQPLLKDNKLKNNPLIITANLPYGWSAWKNNSSSDSKSIRMEPALALFTGENGLALYRRLLEEIKILNRTLTALFEFDPRQTEMLSQLIISILPNAKIEIKKDLAGRDRLAIIKI